MAFIDLDREHPELAKSYHRLLARLDKAAPANELIPVRGNDDVSHEIDERLEAANEMDSLLRQIRLQPGFE